ncbi:hypothetical protein [Desulfobulbus sp.]|uniref:hypothetical protein n=1 Tax=Desulfobulbus sp. TaxID=895 RepID=UPI0027BA032A|nr:hypothetical protein [Desulfobulbus sp.]
MKFLIAAGTAECPPSSIFKKPSEFQNYGQRQPIQCIGWAIFTVVASWPTDVPGEAKM